MAEHGALATLKDLAEKEVEDAARLLGEMRRGCQQAEEQLKMLIDYRRGTNHRRVCSAHVEYHRP